MKTFKNLKYIGLIALAVSFTACNDEEDFEEFLDQQPNNTTLPALTAGTADFSNYVSLGASFTAGFADGGLFMAGQEASFPNTMSKQFANAGGGSFLQPLTADNYGGLAVGGTRIQDPRLVFGGAGPVPLESVIGPVTVGTDLLMPPTGPFNNIGVPGLKSFHLLAPGYGNLANLASGAANPYATRITGTTPNATLIELALAQSPSFFTLSEVGGNDVLSYAISGGTGINQTGNLDPSTYGGNDITDPNVFANVFSISIDALTAGGAKGVVANVPYITDLAHFTTVPHNPLDPTNPAFGPQIPTLNATFASLNGAFDFLGMPERSIVFSETEASPVVVHDETLANIQPQLFAVLTGGGLDAATAGVLSTQFAQSRQATAEDLLVLPSSSVIATVNVTYYTQLVTAGVPAATAGQLSVNGVTYPLEDKWVLLPSEQAEVKTATDAYNVTIASIASSKGLALVDFNTILSEASSSTGITFDDYRLNTSLVTGGLISLDGIHLTGVGYALMANKFLEAIDTTYGSNFIASGNVSKAEDFRFNYPASL